jgi:trimethylamine:corrinoid methyltransferase-like protein
MDREPWVIWDGAGRRTMEDRIRARLRRILDSHEPPPLPDTVSEKIAEILAVAEARGGE